MALGLQDEANAVLALGEHAPCKIYPWHAQAFSVWAAVWRSWKTIGGVMGPSYRVGLDLTQVRAAVELRQIPPADWPELLDQLQIMETEALAVLAEQAKQEAR